MDDIKNFMLEFSLNYQKKTIEDIFHETIIEIIKDIAGIAEDILYTRVLRKPNV